MSVLFFACLAKASVTLPSGTSFENLAVGEAIDFSAGDTGSGSAVHWWGIPTYSTEAKVMAYDGDDRPTGARPEMFSGSNDKYLFINGPDKLYRTVADNPPTVRPFESCPVETGIYFDTFVKFTSASAIDPTEPDDRIYLWLRAVESEDGTPLLPQLVVVAGYLFADNRACPCEYVITHLDGVALDDSFDREAWHRLTIKALAEISDDANAMAPGFVVFIDGKLASAAAPKGEAGSYLDRLNPLARKWADRNALFPSLWSPKDYGGQDLTAAALLGRGSIDDVSFTKGAPTFVSDEKALIVRCTDPHVTQITCKVGSGSAQTLTLTDGEKIVTLGADDAYDVALTAVYEAGYERGNWRYNGAVTSDSSFRVTTFGTVVITARGNQQLCEADGRPYASLDEAFASVRPGDEETVTLLADIESGAYGEVLEGAKVTLDLAGHTIKGGDFVVTEGGFNYVTGAVIDNFGSLVIIDSSAGKTGVIESADAEKYVCVWNAGLAELTVEAGIFKGEIVDGTDHRYLEGPSAIVIAGGKYQPFGADKTTTFYLADYLAEGASANYASPYWIVSMPMTAVLNRVPVAGEGEDEVKGEGEVEGEGEGVKWDLPGVNGGLQALVDAHGNKMFKFTALNLTPTGATVGITAAKIDADGERFGLICKTSFGTFETVVLNATLAADPGATTGVFTITADLSGYTQLFVVGIGPAAGEQ